MKLQYLGLTLLCSVVLLGAGCSSTIQKDVGGYTYDKGAKTSFAGEESNSFRSEGVEYKGNGRVVGVGVSKEITVGGSKQYIVNLLSGGEGEFFKNFSVGDGKIYFVPTQEDQGPRCFLIWSSKENLIRISGIQTCDREDDLVQAYIKKYPPTAITE